jgi:uncharacterized protein (DUF433 family)
MAIETGYRHVVLNEKGVPVIEDTTMKVIELVVEKLAYGWSPEELHFQHPFLTPGQIHAALSYYWDHAEEFDREIAERLKAVDDLRVKQGPSPLVARLKERGLP